MVSPTALSLWGKMSQVGVLVCIISKLTLQPVSHAFAEGACAKHLPTHTVTPVTAANMRDTNWSQAA